MKSLCGLLIAVVLLNSLGVSAQTYIMGTAPTITTCSGTFYDSGGEFGNYNLNEENVVTFYSASVDSAIYFRFEYFNAEIFYDSLFVYNGPDTLSPLLEVITGDFSAINVSSSNPHNCLTFRFISDELMQDIGWKATIGCGNIPPPPPPLPPGFSNTCNAAIVFCTDSSYSIAMDTDKYAEFGPDYDCLGSQPNPLWFRVLIDSPGSLDIELTTSNNVDVDFICWGPFNMPNMCDELTNYKVVDCSFQPDEVEYINIPNGLSGHYYMICVTNYSNDPTFAQLKTSPNSVATTNCDQSCLLDLKAAISSCNPNDLTTSIKCNLWASNPPDTGYLAIHTSTGVSLLIPPPFNAENISEIYNVPTGNDVKVWAYFTVDSSCIDTVNVSTVVPSINIAMDVYNLTDPNVPNGSITANVTGGQPPYTYNWSNGGESYYIYFLPVGTYNVTVTDARGCIAYADASISVETNAGFADLASNNGVVTIPNPATTQLRFEFTGAFSGEGFVFGTDGKLFDTFAINNQVETLNIANLPAGVYVIHVRDRGTNATSFTRVVKY